MKICMLSTGHAPLDDRIYYKEVISLAKRFSPIILVMPGEQSDYIYEENGIRFVPLRKAESLITRFLIIPQAIKKVIKIQPQVCHIHDYELIFILPFLRLFSRCKIIYDVHEVYPEMVMESKKIPRLLCPFMSKLVDISEKILSKLANYIITADGNISKRFSNMNNHVTTIFNYPRLSLFTVNEKKLSLLKERYKNRTPIIYQGGIAENRGLFQMIRAMRILKDKKPDIILLLLGQISNNLLKRVKMEIKENRLQKYIEIVGWLPHREIVEYICISKVGLVPLLPTKKFMKNIPIKQFEYMACGVPVLGANLPPIASYITASACGKVFDSTSIESLANGVIDILQDKSEWKRMSDAGKKATREMWNWDKMEERLFNVYEELLSH